MKSEWQFFWDLIDAAVKQEREALDFVDVIPKHELVINKFLDSVPKKLRCVYQCAIAVAKWHPDRKHPGGTEWFTCAFCAQHFNPDPKVGRAHSCSPACPLVQAGEWCLGSNKSVFRRWDLKPTRKNAMAMFRILNKIYATELAQLEKEKK